MQSYFVPSSFLESSVLALQSPVTTQEDSSESLACYLSPPPATASLSGAFRLIVAQSHFPDHLFSLLGC